MSKTHDKTLNTTGAPATTDNPTTSGTPMAKTYLLHGFRWSRRLIRIYVIMQSLDSVASDWIVGPESTQTLILNLRRQFPTQMALLPNLRFVEQFDLGDTSGVTQEYAYVADFCQQVHLGLDIDEVRGRGIQSAQWQAMHDLRDFLNAFDEPQRASYPLPKLGWYVVHCADELRGHAPLETAPVAAASGGRLSDATAAVGSSFEHCLPVPASFTGLLAQAKAGLSRTGGGNSGSAKRSGSSSGGGGGGA